MKITPRERMKREQSANKRLSELRLNKEKDFRNLEIREKLELDICELKSKIRNCEIDLEGMFKGNVAIIDKLNLLKIQLNNKIKELGDLDTKCEGGLNEK